MKIGVNAIGMESHASGLGVYTRGLVGPLSQKHDGLTVYVSGHGIHPIENARIMPITGGHSRSSKLLRLLATQAILPRRMRRDKISVCLSTSPLQGLISPPAPQVTVVHDLIPLVIPGEQPRVRYYFQYVLPLILKRSRAVITVSEHTKHDLVKIMHVERDKIRVVYNGYDRNAFHQRVDARGIKSKYNLDRYILYVGDQSPHKNVKTLISAFSLSSACREGRTLVIAGQKDPRYYPDLQAHARRVDVSDRVTFPGYVPFKELPGLYRGADAFVFVSQYEGFGLPVIEAMACGTPVLASSTSSLPEVVGGAGLLVDPNDPGAIAESLDRVLQDSELRAHLVQKGLRHAENFSWAKCAEETLEVCREVQQEAED